MAITLNNATLVTIYGGSGFLGRHVVRALAKTGARMRIAVRRPELAGHLQPLELGGESNVSATQDCLFVDYENDRHDVEAASESQAEKENRREGHGLFGARESDPTEHRLAFPSLPIRR